MTISDEDDDDIIDALDAGILDLYVNDFPNERYLNHPKIICFPHLGASTDEAEENCAIMVVNQVKEFLDQYGLNNLSIKNNSLADIFNNKFWQDLHSSFTGNRLFECAMTCGKRLTKVWDQGGNRR